MLDGIIPPIFTDILDRPVVGVLVIDLLLGYDELHNMDGGPFPVSLPTAITHHGDAYAGLLA